MDAALRTLFSPAYLVEPEPGPLGPLLPLYLFAGLLFAAGLVGRLAMLARRGDLSPRPSPFQGGEKAPFPEREGGWRVRLARVELALCGLGLILTLARFWNVPVLSMRLLFYAALLAAGGAALAERAAPPLRTALWGRLRDAIAFRFDPVRRPLSWGFSLAFLALHLLGLALTWEFLGRPFIYAIPAVVLLLLPQLLLWLRRGRPALYVEALTPLLLVYIVLGLHLAGLALWRVLDRSATGLRLPPPWGTVLDPGPLLILALAAALAYDVYMALVAWGREGELLRYGAAALTIIGFGWAAGLYFSARTHGVTGSDPYAYTQMAVDLARRGAPFHIFPLAQTVQVLGLPVKPALPVGYRPPFDAAGHSATVWPPGHSALLALAYRLVGEPGLYLATPLLGLLSLAATWVLAQTVFAVRPPVQRRFIGGIAVFLLATSFEQTSRTVVPLADISAQLFTTLTLALALKYSGQKVKSRYLLPIALGLSLGLAYAMRYTQVLLAPSVLIAMLFLERGTLQPQLRPTLYAAAAALLVALPDLWYHQIAFGSPLRTGTEEFEQFALANVVPVIWRVGGEVLAAGEFLFFAPFVALALWRLARTDRRALTVLLAGPLLVALFHLPYGYLRLRDLLSLYPVLAVLAGAGLLETVERLGMGERHTVYGVASVNARRSTPARFTVFLVTVALPLARLGLALPMAQGFYTFGTLLPPQRAAFDRLAALTAPAAVVGSSLNGGAVDLYSGRASFRPAAWAPEELLAFVRAMQQAGRPVYLLDDGVELGAPLRALAGTHRLTPIAQLPLPYFYVGGGSENQDVTLYEVK